MKTPLIALVALLVLGSTACGAWYVGPTVGYSYYAPAPYAAAPVYAYPAPAPYVAYSPVVQVPVVAPAPVWIGRPVVVGPAGKVYVVGRPVRNAVRAVLP
jgi:hypothetical protein